MRSPILNMSYRYNFGYENETACNCYSKSKGFKNALGAQLHTVFRPNNPQPTLTAFYNTNLLGVINTKFTYSINKYSYTNFGFGASLNTSRFNCYLLMNNLLAYRDVYKAQSLSLQLGFNLIFK